MEFKRKCHQCKKMKMKVVRTFGGDHILGLRCESCGARRAQGDSHAPKEAWPKAQAWIERRGEAA